MKTLIDIFKEINFGDIILFQRIDLQGKYSKPKLAVIVGEDVWDMAAAIHYVDYKSYKQYLRSDAEQYYSSIEECKVPEIRIESFGEWMEYLNILGHWHSFPDFKELLAAYRNKVEKC